VLLGVYNIVKLLVLYQT